MSTEQSNEIRPSLSSYERRINFGNYEDAKRTFQLLALPTEEGQREITTRFLNIANEWELLERRNAEEMRVKGIAAEAEVRRQNQLKRELLQREKTGLVFQLLQKDPLSTVDDIASKLVLTLDEVRDCLYALEHKGKIKPRNCRRLFDVVETTDQEQLGDPEQQF